jgi:hypothetical protein
MPPKRWPPNPGRAPTDAMDKREAERFPMRIPATVFVREGDLEEIVTAETENISCRGTLLKTDAPLPEGLEVELMLYLPRDKWLELLGPKEMIRLTVRGTVVRTQKEGLAVEFHKSYQIQSFDTVTDQVRPAGDAEGR